MTMQTRLPYPGLRAFKREESDLFFGREDCIDTMVDKLAETRFLAVLGASGCGKSSLVRTGLFEALEIGFMSSAGSRWNIADIHPGGQPLRNLALGLLRATGKADDDFNVDLLRSFLSRGPKAIIEWCRDGHLDTNSNLLILADQFEELFRYGDYAAREEAEAFVALLIECAATPDIPIYIVITMRSEYLSACALLPELAERINASLYLTPRMTRSECREAIEGPAGVIGFNIEPALVNRLLNDLAGFAPWETDPNADQLQRLSRRADQLPLMQHVLNRLWLRAVESDDTHSVVLTLADYEQIGCLQGALDAHAAEVVDSLTDEQKPLVEILFRALMDGASVSNTVRRPCRLAELIELSGGNRAPVIAVIDAFRAPDCNFIRPGMPEVIDDETIIDLSHESLIRQWSQLATWLNHEARSASYWRRLLAAMEQHAGGVGNLLSGLDLANFQAWWRDEQPNAAWTKRYNGSFAPAKDFLDASLAAEEQLLADKKQRALRERKLLQMALGLFIILTVTAVSSYIYVAKAYKIAAHVAEAYQMAAHAPEDFLIDIAEKLRLAPGIPGKDVEDLLKQGEDYLNRIPESVTDQQTRDRSMAKIFLKFANVYEDRGELEKMRDRALAARNKVLSGRKESDLSRVETALLAETYLAEGRSYDSEDSFKRAGDIFVQAEPLAVKASDDLLAAKFHYWIGAEAWSLDNKDKNVPVRANQCLSLISGLVSELYTDDVIVLKANCQLLLGLNADALSDLKAERRYYESVIKTIESIPQQQRNIAAIKAYSTALSNIGWTEEHNAGSYENARASFKQAADNYEHLLTLNPENIKTQDAYAKQLRSLGKAYQSDIKLDNHYSLALEIYKKAQSIREKMDPHDANNPKFLNNFETLLDDMAQTTASINGYDKNKEQLQFLIAIKRKSIDVRNQLLAIPDAPEQQGRADYLDGNKSDLAQALLTSAAVLEEDHYDEAEALFAELLQKCDAGYAAGSLTIYAKKTCFWTINALPVERRNIPLITGIDKQLAILESTRNRLSAFLKRFKDVWLVESKLGAVNAELAQLYFAKGLPDQALEAAKAGADLYTKQSIELLADWYATGSGPVAADKTLADDYKKRLDARDWSMIRFTVPGDLRWTEENDKWPYPVYISNPRFAGDEPFERVVYQLENFEGVSIPDEVKESFRKLFKIAVENKVSFTELTVYAIAANSSADQIAAKLNDNKEDIFVVISEEWNRKDGNAAVTEALHKVSDKLKSDMEFRRKLLAASLKLYQKAAYEPGIAILTELIDTASGDPDELTKLYQLRAKLFDQTNNADKAESDLLFALTLAPDDAGLLNSLGYSWVQRDKLIPAAIKLLERAVANAPKNPNIIDSLGWAYVKSGQLDQGLAKLMEAIAIDPTKAEIHAHIADTYRRQNQPDKAKKEFEVALTLKPDDEVFIFIQTQQRLLGIQSINIPTENEAIGIIAETVVKEHLNTVQNPAISTDTLGVAIQGYDPVAYITDKRATKGNAQYFAVWEKALWFFVSEENRKRFIADPASYLPGFGGYCTYCMSLGHKLHGDPNAWAVYKNKLYLHQSTDLRDKWLKDPDTYLEKAEAMWTNSAQTKTDPNSNTAITIKVLARIEKDRNQ